MDAEPGLQGYGEPMLRRLAYTERLPSARKHIGLAN